MIDSLIILLCLIIWLMSCVICALVGFFIGIKEKFKAKPKTVSKRNINVEETRKAERLRKEYYNMLHYDGTPQDVIDL